MPDDAAGAERDVEAALATAAACCRRDPDIGAGGHRHADVADQRGEDRADEEEQRAADADARSALVDRQDQQQEEHDDREHAERAELPVQVRGRALLDRFRDLLHLRRALVGTEHLLHQHVGEDQSGDGEYADHRDQALLPARDAGSGVKWCVRHATTPL